MTTNESEFIESVSEWGLDIQREITANLEALCAYVGIEFPDCRLIEIASEATVIATRLMIEDIQAGRTREVLSNGKYPDFCSWLSAWTPEKIEMKREEVG